MEEQTDMLRQAYIHMRSAEEADSPEGAIFNTNLAHAYATIAQAEAATRQAEAMERTTDEFNNKHLRKMHEYFSVVVFDFLNHISRSGTVPIESLKVFDNLSAMLAEDLSSIVFLPDPPNMFEVASDEKRELFIRRLSAYFQRLDQEYTEATKGI